MSANEQKLGHFWIDLQRTTKTKLQSTIIHVTKTLIIILGHWNRKKLETHICYSSKLFLADRPIPSIVFVLSALREFSFIFRCKVCSTAGGNIKKLEILPRLHFERAKSTERLDETRKWQQSDAILNIQHSGRTGTSNCLVHKMMNYQMAKKTKKKQTGLSATYYSSISSSITTFR